MVMIDQIPWHEMDVDGEPALRTRDDFSRRLETRLQALIGEPRPTEACRMRKCALRICLAVAFVGAIHALAVRPATAQGSGAANNLLRNPSFEEGPRDALEGWQPRAWRDSQKNAQWGVDPSGRTGRCVTIGSANEKGADAAWTARVTVKANTFYRLSGWIRARDVRGATGALLNVQNMQSVRTPAVRGTCDWTRVSAVFRTAAGPLEIEVNCLFGGWGESTGQAWYDDVAVEPLGDIKEAPMATVTIDTAAEPRRYSPMIFSGFLEHFGHQVYGGVFDPGSPLSDEMGFRKDVIAAMKELKLATVRWPGGCFVSGYHWKEGVGKDRKPSDDMAWGVKEPNTFGTDEFVEWCRRVGCEPYICTNAGNGTPEEMRDWVEYCNQTEGPCARMRIEGGHVQPLGVHLWSVGNENWGGHEIGTKSVAEWGPFVARSAALMKAADPSIQLTAAALPNKRWTLPLLKAAGEHLDYISIHSYWLPLWRNNATPDYLTCIMQSEGPEKVISDTISVLEEAGCRGRIRIAFDEWNLRGWHHPGFPRKAVSRYDDPEVVRLIKAREKNLIASQYTMADALFSASFLNACLRHADDVAMANIAPIVNTRGPLFVHPKGVVKRTTFHVLAMYASLLGSRIAKAGVDAGMLVHGDRFIPVVDAIASVDDAGKTWSIALANRHPSESVDCTLRLGDAALAGTFDATVLAGDSPDAYNDIEHPNRVAPERKQLTFQKGVAKLPPHSLAIVRVPAARPSAATP